MQSNPKQRRLDSANQARVDNKKAMQVWVLELVLNGKTVKEIEMITNYSKSRIYEVIKMFDEEFVTDAYFRYFNMEHKVFYRDYETFLKLNCNYKQYKKQYVKKEIIISEWGEEIEVVPEEVPKEVPKEPETIDWYTKMKEKVERARFREKLADIMNYDRLMTGRQNFAAKVINGVNTYNVRGEQLSIEEIKKLHDSLLCAE